MKHGKKPTLAQCRQLAGHGLESRDYLIVRNLPNTLHVVHRNGGDILVLDKSENTVADKLRTMKAVHERNDKRVEEWRRVHAKD